MTAVAEKQVKTARTPRAVARAAVPWSRARAPEHAVLREIVGSARVQAKSCDGCADELQVQRLPGEEEQEPRIRRAVAVGAADDPHERQADAVAERVMRMPEPAEEKEEEEELPDEAETAVQAKRHAIGPEGGEVRDPAMAARLEAPGTGRPLPAALRAFIEPRLAYDFSDVRVHDSAEDRRDAATLRARAFAYGRHIWIGPGESADDPRLMAHELTHVVQQGAARRVVQRDAEEAQEPGFLARMALGLVRRYAPGLEPVLSRGPLNWLKDRLAGAFNGLAGGLNRLNPRAALDTLVGVFDGLVARAEPIVTALRSGDCGPLFQAITDLKNFVTDMAASAWDGLVDFVRPVGEFFTGLWEGYGAPAMEWLQRVAGDVWDAIRAFGSEIWESTRPIRDAIGGAWAWVKEQLFGPEDESSGDSEGGIVGWIQRKALEAWEAIKQATEPVWQPVVAAAEHIRALIPPPFVRRLGEQFRNLSANINQAAQQMDGGEDVAENRAALAAALPTVQEVIAGVREIIAGAQGWLLEKVGAVGGTFTGLVARLRGHALLRPLAGLLGWLEEAAQGLVGWARDKVASLFAFVLRAFDFLSPFVQRVVTTVQNVIGVVGDLLQLPSLVLNAVWNLIPACIRNPIRDFLVNQILARIPVFSTLLELPDIWARIEATALRILRQVFVDGNLARAAWTFFSSVLEVLGLPPQLVVSVLAKAAAAIGDILSDPVGFLLNLLSAIKEGFIRFFDNVWTHLLGGVTGWLFGQLARGGLQPPQDFSLRSILGFVLQVLDITVDRVFERLARRLDAAIVQRLRQALAIATGVWRFVAVLIEEGPAGLWREIQTQLGNLWDRVLNAVIGWLTRTVIARVSARLLTMLDPTGVMAVVNSLIALYRAIQSAIEYLREMLEIVDRVLDGINGIARGAIDIAAGFLETALAAGLPVAIGFLANQIGLRNFGERIQEMVEGVRAQVDRAIDWLIDRAIAGGQALISMLRRGAAAVRNWWTARKPFTSAQGESHTLYFEGSGSAARLMIRSDPQTYADFIRGVDVPPGSEQSAAKARALVLAQQLDQIVAGAGGGAGASAAAGAPGGGAEAGDASARIDELLDGLARETALFMPRVGGATPAVYGPLAEGFGSSARVERLQRPCPGGSEPTSAAGGPDWDTLRRRQIGEGTYYIRGHLLNNHLGGPGNTWTNLTPIPRRANSAMSRDFEEPVKAKVLNEGRIVHFRVSARYGRSHPLASMVSDLASREDSPDDRLIAQIIRAEQKVPVRIECEADVMPGDGRPQERIAPPGGAIAVEIEDRDPEYQLTPAPIQPLYVDAEAQAGNAAGLQRLGMSPAVAQAVIAGRPAGGYRRRAQLEQKGVDWDRAVGTQGLRVRIYRRS